MPTLQETKRRAKTIKTYQQADKYGKFEEFEAEPEQSYYRERAQGGYEFVTPESPEAQAAQPFYRGGGTSLWSTAPSGPAGPGGKGSDWYLSGFGEWKRVGGGGAGGPGGGAAPGPGGPQPIGSQVTQTTTYTPPVGPQPTFQAPAYRTVGYNKRRVSFLRQQAAAPARRAAIRSLQQAFTASYASGPLKAMAIRNALREYGSAYAQIMASSGAEARAEYQAETAEQRAANLAEYQGALTAAQQEFNAAWQAWLKTGGTETTQTTVPVYEEGAQYGGSPQTSIRKPAEKMVVGGR